MQTRKTDMTTDDSPEIIRVETALSRFPIHRLSKQGAIAIELTQPHYDGGVTIKWGVSPNPKYGQPGPLAYKVDTLAVNRKIDETRPAPKLLRLGTQNEICALLGTPGTSKNRADVRQALQQNAATLITARIQYKTKAGVMRSLDTDFTRYTAIFTGETLPDGARADGTFLLLNDIYREILNMAEVRPLDYRYLQTLSPAAQRLYELVSFKIYGALLHGLEEVAYSYRELCTYAPMACYQDFAQAQKQLYKLHKPHLASAYLKAVRTERFVDDLLIRYTPGALARTQFLEVRRKARPLPPRPAETCERCADYLGWIKVYSERYPSGALKRCNHVDL